MGCADGGGGEALEGAHGDGGVLHNVFEQVVVVDGGLGLRADLRHHLHRPHREAANAGEWMSVVAMPVSLRSMVCGDLIRGSSSWVRPKYQSVVRSN